MATHRCVDGHLPAGIRTDRPAGIAGNVIAQPNPVSTGSGEEPSVVRVAVADRADLERLIAGGIDVTEYARQTQEGIEVDVVATPSQLKSWRSKGFAWLKPCILPSEWRARVKEREEALAEKEGGDGRRRHRKDPAGGLL